MVVRVCGLAAFISARLYPSILHYFFSAIVAKLTKRLPVVGVPEQGLIALVWNFVVHDCRGCDLAFLFAEATKRVAT